MRLHTFNPRLTVIVVSIVVLGFSAATAFAGDDDQPLVGTWVATMGDGSTLTSEVANGVFNTKKASYHGGWKFVGRDPSGNIIIEVIGTYV